MEVDVVEMMKKAKELGASDIHISVNVEPSCRVDGSILRMEGYWPLTGEDTEKIVRSVMPPSEMEKLEERGELDFSFGVDGAGRFRINAFRQRGNYAMVARLINSEVPDPEKLGLPEALLGTTRLKRGLVLVTGPTGSGKSTTLAAILGIINRDEPGHIVTMEDPIEFLHHHKRCIVNQREMGVDSVGGYGSALRAALRQDPDVLLVGEMRDLETIGTAVTAAETGHLVFSTLHTIGAAATIDRVLDVFPPHQQPQVRAQLAEVIQCVCSQQLMPRAGGKGRVAALEIMIANHAIRNLIREGKISQIASSMQTGKRAGMITMDDAIFARYKAREITADVAINYAQDQTAMASKVR
ncbi:MAG: type IV pilus twitching motility protein PilT [Eubacteriales bacterium]